MIGLKDHVKRAIRKDSNFQIQYVVSNSSSYVTEMKMCLLEQFKSFGSCWQNTQTHKSLLPNKSFFSFTSYFS